MDVTGRLAIVTGGGQGIGRGIVMVLAKHGADVVIADVNLETAKSTAAEVEGLGRQSAGIVTDVTDQTSVDRMVQETIGRFGQIDILVNNAGVFAAPDWEDRGQYGEEDWDFIYAVNVKGVARMTDAVSQHMKERRYGKVINTASVVARRALPDITAYSASKAAVISLTQAAAQELAPFNINVNAICPGGVWTPMTERESQHWSLSPENVDERPPHELFELAMKSASPLGRAQTPEDFGNIVTFLASDYARNITGQSINVDGGAFMS